jgi:HK97 gp10 family phage protein
MRSGLRKALADLDRFDRKMRTEAMPRALEAAARILVDRIESRAPRETGRLAHSVEHAAGKPDPDFVSHSVFVTGGHDSPMVGAVEYGTHRMVASPFFRPAISQSRSSMVKTIERRLAQSASKF